MKSISLFVLSAAFVLAGFGCSSVTPSLTSSINGGGSTQTPSSTTTGIPTQHGAIERPKIEVSPTNTLTFAVDAGKRVEMASNAGLSWQADGSLAMVYENLSAGGEYVASTTSTSDFLTFGSGTKITSEVPYRAMRLEDGTFRAFGFDPTRTSTNPCLTSMSSKDGVTFTQDTGCRYTLQADDNGGMGVYATYKQADGKVVLLYIGDLHGKNNIRRAVSSDGGWTFTFDRGNVLGDDSFGGGARSYVDERVIKLTDGTYYLIAMSSGSIYAFLSTDGDQFSALPELILSPSDFASLGNYISLNDPQITLLSDGRYRIYVTALAKEGTGPTDRGSADLVSATAPALAK